MAHIYYCKCGDKTNFGDLIGPWLHEKITGKQSIYADPKKESKIPIYFCAGSILHHSKPNVILWGTGMMFRNTKFENPKKVLCVRGPLTRKRLIECGVKCPKVFGDPGLLLSKYYQPKQCEKKYQLGIIPHYVDFEHVTKLVGNNSNVVVINLLDDIENVIDKITECEMTISSSLHGIIASHSYGIKSWWVKFSDKIKGDNTKYLDYYQSVGIHTISKPLIIKKFENVENIIKKLKNIPNPKFPIDTSDLEKSCPFY